MSDINMKPLSDAELEHVSGGGAHGGPTKTTYYTVMNGDTVKGICIKFNTTTAALKALNPGVNFNPLSVGTKIRVS